VRIHRLVAGLALVFAIAGTAVAQTFRDGLEQLSPDGGALRSVELTLGGDSLTVTGIAPAPPLPLTLSYRSLSRLAYAERTAGGTVRHVLKVEFTRDASKTVGSVIIGMPAGLAPRIVSTLEARTRLTAVRTKS
jgi:hypothetical protein